MPASSSVPDTPIAAPWRGRQRPQRPRRPLWTERRFSELQWLTALHGDGHSMAVWVYNCPSVPRVSITVTIDYRERTKETVYTIDSDNTFTSLNNSFYTHSVDELIVEMNRRRVRQLLLRREDNDDR